MRRILIPTAATAAPGWIAARDAYLNHMMLCRSCCGQTGRHCETGAQLRQKYDSEPMRLQQPRE